MWMQKPLCSNFLERRGFAFVTDGARENYAGVTTEVLEDGYIRVTFDLNAITQMTGTPSTVISFMYIRNYDWSDANC